MKLYIKSATVPLSKIPMADRVDIAKDPDTSLDILEELANSKSMMVCRALALNPNVTHEILIKLFNKAEAKEDYVIAHNISKNPNLNADLLDKYASSSHDVFRCVASYNKLTPIPTLKKLLKDKYDRVRSYAERTLRELGEI